MRCCSPASGCSAAPCAGGRPIMRSALLAGLAAAVLSAPAQAVPIGGVEFPQGAASFADAVQSYAPGIVPSGPTAPHQGTFNALGAPNYPGGTACASQLACSYVSLGDGGNIVLRFDDNKLTGSGS